MLKLLSPLECKISVLISAVMIALISVILSSCQNDEMLCDESSNIFDNSIDNKISLKKDFAQILSQVTYENEEVRNFLKNEAIKQFDKNYDVLYALIRNELVDTRTFREILINYSSEEEINRIEKALPLLNILIPDIAFFEINAMNMDCSDNEIPVAVSNEKGTSLYINGVCEGEIPNGEIPGFHVFVVNENSRVIVDDNVSRGETANVRFISPNYDGKKVSRSNISRADTVSSSMLDRKMIEAYNYFYKDDGSLNSMSYQRDYIYYGLTPTNSQGSLNRSVSEYLSFIKIEPNAYNIIADQNLGLESDDPVLSATKRIKYNKAYTDEALIDAFWKKGSFDFRIEVISANSSQPIVLYIPVAPSDLWDLNASVSVKKGNMFHRRKYTYTVDPSKFIAKKYYLGGNKISLGKWDLSEEALYRYINIYEEDVAANITYEESYEMTKMTSAKVNGSVKIGLGTDKITGSFGGETIGSATETVRKTYKIERKEGSDELGKIKIYFYDPLIIGKNGSNYVTRTYHSGSVEIGIVVE